MYCQRHNAWDCMDRACWGYYGGLGYQHSGMEIGYDASTGGIGAFEDFGGGVGIDLTDGEPAIDIGGIIIDI